MGFEQVGKRSTTGDAQGAAPGGQVGVGKHTLVEKLAQTATTVGALRAQMAAQPELGRAIPSYFADGNDAPGLNELMGRAYAPEATRAAATSEKVTASETVEKAGTGAGAALPAERSDSKVLSKGTYKWTFKAETTSRPLFEADFKPDKDKVQAKNVSFAQTVLNQVGTKKIYAGGTTANPDLKKATYEPYEEATKHTRIDHMPGSENDPYYGAEWDASGKKWVKEATPNSKLGNSNKGVSSSNATMRDRPDDGPVAREGMGKVSIEFETAAVALETREPLGSLKWGFTIEDRADAPLVLTGGTKADCVDSPSGERGAAMDKFYEAKFETMLDSFAAGKADLTAGHKTSLDTLATKLTGDVTLKAELSGAADLKEPDAAKVSDERAKAARDYLAGKGIAAGRLTIVALGSDWARVETTAGADEPKNRRVQIWVKK